MQRLEQSWYVRQEVLIMIEQLSAILIAVLIVTVYGFLITWLYWELRDVFTIRRNNYGKNK